MFLLNKNELMSLALKAEDSDFDRQISFDEIEGMDAEGTVDAIPLSFNDNRGGEKAATTVILECTFGGMIRFLEVSRWEYHKLLANVGHATVNGLISGISAPKGRLYLAVSNR